MKTVLFLFLGLVIYADQPLTGLEVMSKYREATAIQDLTGELTYTNISKTGRTQTRTLKQYILCTDAEEYTYNLVLEFTSPQDVSGTATLTIQHAGKDDDQWLYLPVLRTSKRISPNKKSDRFMGTEITYEDLSGYLSEPLEDYSYTMVGEEAVEGRQAYLIEALPRAGVKTQYAKRRLWIDQQTHLMLRTEFFDQKNTLLKTYVASDIRSVGAGKHVRAHRVVMHNVQTGNRTEVSYRNFAIDQQVQEEIFTKTWLETR